MALNEKYSYKDFTGQYLTSVPASEFNNTEIIGSCFHIGNEPFSKVFPDGMTGVTFTKCSLSNCIIPPGNTVHVKEIPLSRSATDGINYVIDADKKCQHRQIANQNDMEQWILNDKLEPIEPLNKKRFQLLGLSIDPNDIPTNFFRREIHFKSEWLATKDTEEVTNWFYEEPQIIAQVTKHVKNPIPLIIWNNTFNKTRWTGSFDSSPTETLGIYRCFDVMILEGDKTIYTLEGKGQHSIKGRTGSKNRPCENMMLTMKKEQDNQQADIDALKTFDPTLAERLGIK